MYLLFDALIGLIGEMPEPVFKIEARLAAIAARPASAFIPPISHKQKSEDRSEPREKVYRFGRLRLATGAAISCVVLDLSRSGARVRFEDAAEGLPELVTLEFEASGVAKRARVAWERDKMAGLQFLDPTKRIFGHRMSPPIRAPLELKKRDSVDAG